VTSVFDSPPPSLTDDQLHQLASAVFGLRGTIASLVSERDQNVRIDTHDGSFVMKVAHAAEDPVALSLQESALEHLRGVDPDLPVPHVMWPGTTTWQDHLVRVVTHLPGTPYAHVPHSCELRRSLGTLMGRVSRAMQGFGHPGAHRPDFLWNLDHALAVEQWVSEVEGIEARTAVLAAFRHYRQRVLPRLPHLRAAVVHQDANDHNVLVLSDAVAGLIDFGDMVHARQVNELAVTLAYALLDVDDIVAAAADVITAYTAEFPLTDDELFVLFDLVAARLAMSIVISSHRSRDFTDNDYLLVSRAPAERLLRRLVAMRPQFLHFVARDAAGLTPVPNHDAVVEWLRSGDCTPASPLPFDLHRAGRIVVSLAKDAPLTAFADDAPGSWRWMQTQMALHDAEVAIGRYDEDRSCYEGDQFVTDAPESRSVHIGIDLFIDEDTPVRAMLPGVVETVVDNDMPYDYGPTVILRHEAGEAGPFWVLYGHLSRRTLTTVRPGDAVHAGQVVGFIGDHTVNGGWAPHVHIQIITDLMADPEHGPDGNFEGAGEPSRMRIWRSIAPDANLLLRLAPETFAPTPDPAELAARRRADLGPSLSISYRRPLTILRGQGTWLVDHTGRAHLDCVNNVAHVGHAHPHVVEAIARQATVLNTNTRYLHPTILEYAERLAATFPHPLSVVYFTNSGSEANELALRIARTATGRHDVIAVDWGYHGNTNDLVEISAYKFNRKGGTGKPPHTHLAELPDPYRGRFGADGPAYAAGITELPPSAAFIAESISGCGGQVVFPNDYLVAAYANARAAGAVCIADEVQVGFGRVGSAMWAFELQGVVPDIVTLGKPIGNGHPLGAVVTTPELAATFANGMEWFNTFGGNPVSCAAGMAVLDVIENEQLQQRALDTGEQLLTGFRALADQHDCIGDVRGHGMYLGIDLVSDRESTQPATALASDICNAMRDRGVLISTDGPADNVLKIKPPIVFGRAEADILLYELGEVLRTIG
jgi:4-aminobutyrate aminotransferase-like enzyme/Ser/Thr protein kinase RdoA (MazF antagonist)